jgi:hypothetical protein
MFELFILLGLMSVFMARLIQGRPLPPKESVHIRFAIALLIVIGITIAARGTGLRILGSSLWGGAHYIHLILLLFAGLFLRNINISQRILLRCIVLSCLFSVIHVFTSNMGSSVEEGIAGMGADTIRREAGAHVASGYLLILAIFVLQKYRRWGLFVGIFVVAMAISLMSGHRIGLLYNGLLLFFVAFYFPPILRRKYIGIMIFSGIIALGLLIAFVDILPLSFQRSLSVIPFLNVSDIALSDASGTTEWRIELWNMLLKEVPDYLWVGKGLGFDLAYASHIFSYVKDNNVTFFTVVHNYHNGPLSMLIDFSVFGLISGIGFMLTSIAHFSKYIKKEWNSPDLKYFFIAFLAYFCSLTVNYIIVYGDMSSAFMKYLTIWFLLEVLAYNGVTKRKEGAVDATAD